MKTEIRTATHAYAFNPFPRDENGVAITVRPLTRNDTMFGTIVVPKEVASAISSSISALVDAGSEGMAVKAYTPADPAEIEAARNAYQDDELNIDDDAAVSHADDGYWVSAWVWIANDDVED